MSDLERRVQADGLLAAGRRVVVLYSGGCDSTCLLDLAVTVAGRDLVTALHVNYGLRAAADQDDLATELFGIERALTGALRRLRKLVTAPRV